MDLNSIANNSLVNDIVDGIMRIATQIAAKFGVAVNAIYPILIKQAYVEGYQYLMGAILGFIAIVFGVMWCVMAYRRYSGVSKSKSNEYGWLAFLGMILIFAGLIAFFSTVFTAINALYNPDYYIAQKIIKLLQNATSR